MNGLAAELINQAKKFDSEAGKLQVEVNRLRGMARDARALASKMTKQTERPVARVPNEKFTA